MLNKNQYELLSSHFPAWDKLTANQQQLIIDNASLLSVKKNSLIQNTSAGCSGILIIKQGTLRVYTLSEQGKEITLYRLNTGDICILSASCVIRDITFDIYIDTLTDCQLIQILPCAFARVMQENIHLEALTYKLATQRLCTVTWAMQQMIFTSFDKRLAEFLLNESRSTGSDEINMTHEQIAKLMGTAREVVTRMLKYFSNENYVQLMRGKVKVLNKQALEKL
ncbi:Crp/Fnr family transcriptional regulator [Megamonas hypermegale]|uniref:Crp/Fnr family transcriptional regulator n=1 Tax=Megamonas hypermegale TaxID=158847 RepID=UPI0025A3425A|nr:Crp/Fnr family transcriptional regulator [Megamonas hypermegale]MDM8142458.1 Crp/Fnr family transcriptional regulator [Megamonas hypermegale]